VRTKFFISLDDLAILGRVARSGAHMREAELLEQLADMAFMIVDAKAIVDHLLKIDASPAYNAVDGRVGSLLDDLGQFGFLSHGKPRFSRQEH
jgi:hypothetical protein